MKNILLAVSLLTTLLFSNSNSNAIETSGQMLVVTTKKWDSPNGILQKYEKTNRHWEKLDAPIEVKLGRNGLGWGIGLHTIPKNAKFIKKEGDGKAPAGIFELKQAFGYQPLVGNYPYEVYQATHHCVDDVDSKLYNKIIDSKKVKKEYKSFEHMKFDKNYYKYGVVVNHNHIDESGAKKGSGSCIFIHIKSIPTAGCTVVKSENQMKELIEWLDPEQYPLLVQGTVETVQLLLKKNHITTPRMLTEK